MTKLEFEYCTPESVGLPSAAVSEFIDRLDRHGLCMHSFIIMRHDKICANGYFSPCRADDIHPFFSVSEAVAAIAVGLLQDDGLLSVDDRISDCFAGDLSNYLPKYDNDKLRAWEQSATVRDCLAMRMSPRPGTVFCHDKEATGLLFALTEKLAKKDAVAYIRERIPELGLSEKLGFSGNCDGSLPAGALSLCGTTDDLLRLTYFLLKKGRICGRSCINEDYISEMTSMQTPTLGMAQNRFESFGYGYGLWMNEHGGFCLCGAGGQIGVFVPGSDLAVVATADFKTCQGGIQMLLDAVYEELLPQLLQGEAPTDEFESDILADRLESLSIKAPAGEAFVPMAMKVMGRHYDFDDNPQGFGEMLLTFDPDREEGTFHYVLAGQLCRIDFGLGHLVEGIFPVYNKKCAAGAAWTGSDTFYIVAHIIDDHVGTVHFTMHFGEGNTSLSMRKVEESLFSEYQGHVYGSMNK